MRVRGDAAEWERVFVNLLLNATEAGATHVCIEAREGVVTVSDDGHGIPPGLLPQIFQPRVSTKSIMAGLGLYNGQSIVQQNGGGGSAAQPPPGGAGFAVIGGHGGGPAPPTPAGGQNPEAQRGSPPPPLID